MIIIRNSKMVRSSFVDNNGLRKGAWSDEEDEKLRAYILRYGHWNWRLLPKYAGLARCGKSCRLRWMNYLKPGLKRGDFSKEVHLIMKMHDELGNKWSAIAAKLAGRTDNEIKNYWHVNIRRLQERNPSSSASDGKHMVEEQSMETSWNSIHPENSDDGQHNYSCKIRNDIDLNVGIDFPDGW